MNSPMTTPMTTLSDVAQACGDGFPLPSIASQGTVFAEPWQAHAFAMTLQLHEQGVFTWPQWAQALTREIRAGQTRGEASDGSLYYTHWLNALEQLVIERGLGTPEQIHELEHAWAAAAERTPHGQAIVLDSPQALG
jgi:nitrile hydratase accessory protein